MSDPTNETTGQNTPNNLDQPQSSQPPKARPLDAMFSAMRKGAEDARKAAERALPRIKAAAGEAEYWGGYGLSFAATFAWTLAKELTPESTKAGLRDGVQAGKGAAQTWVGKMRHPEASSTAAPPQLLPGTNGTQPGVV